MPSWGEILTEVTSTAKQDGSVDVDGVRRKYLGALQAKTGNSVVLYATDFLGKNGPQTSIQLTDMQGLMEVFRGLPGPNLDLVLHSPGGQAEATERLVRYMRSKFDRIRMFIPLAAMSAATMWAMSADELVMGKHSQVGPIDPQVTIPGGLAMPAGALVDQFEQAMAECSKDPTKITGWLPTLQQYPPGLINLCESAAALSKTLVGQWLSEYMLAGSKRKATSVAKWLADDKTHLSHSRAITREDLVQHGVPVTPLEDDQELQDLVLSVHHSALLTFQVSNAVKIIENHQGHAFIQHGGAMAQAPIPR